MLELTIIHGGKSDSINFGDEPNPTVGDLMSLLESKYNVRRNDQKLIFGGKILTNEDSTLVSHNIKSGSKIMFIGRAEVIDNSQVEKLSRLEASLSSLRSDLDRLKAKVDTLTSEEVVGFTEDCMRKLELADSVVLPPNAHEYRKRRKDFIDNVNRLLLSADELLISLGVTREK